MNSTRLIWLTVLCCGIFGISASAQEAILPQGDPRLQATEDEAAKRKDIRDSRLTQQGQGPNYRVEGEAKPSSRAGDTSAESPGLARQDTGIADPSTNPGQASGMLRVQGRVIHSQPDRYIVRQSSGSDATLMVDARTAGDKDLHPGDIITGLMTAQGRAVVIKKEQSDHTER